MPECVHNTFSGVLAGSMQVRALQQGSVCFRCDDVCQCLGALLFYDKAQGTARSFTPRIFTAAWRDTSERSLVVFMLQRVGILCSLLLLAPTRASQLYELASLVVEDESPEPDLTTDHRRRRHGSVDPVDSQARSEAPVISTHYERRHTVAKSSTLSRCVADSIRWNKI